MTAILLPLRCRQDVHRLKGLEYIYSYFHIDKYGETRQDTLSRSHLLVHLNTLNQKIITEVFVFPNIIDIIKNIHSLILNGGSATFIMSSNVLIEMTANFKAVFFNF